MSASVSGDFPLRFLHNEEWAGLLQEAEILEFEQGRFLFEAGHQPRGVLVIIRGTASVRSSNTGEELLLAGPGCVLGELSLIDPRPAEVNVVALEKVEFFYIRHQDVYRQLGSQPGFEGRLYRSLTQILAERLERTTRRSLADKPN